MLETSVPAIPSPTDPKKTNPWIIVIAGCVLLCCFCIGATGLLFAFGGPILNELGLVHALLPSLMI
jgi:hypothetical protein